MGAKKTLRMLVWPECNRSCPGCCNKDWDLNALPVCTDFTPYEMVILTGGEPMLHPAKLNKAIDEVVSQAWVPIVVYTAKSDDPMPFVELAQRCIRHEVPKIGFTVTLHGQSDVAHFDNLSRWLFPFTNDLNLRLNVFSGIDISSLNDIYLADWRIKTGIEWIVNCPLPSNEVFMRWGG